MDKENSTFKKIIYNKIAFTLLLLTACSSQKETVTPIYYDPPGATITTDKEITPQHYRTISFSNTGVSVSNEFEGARLNDFYQVNETTYTAVIKPENGPVNNSAWYAFKIYSMGKKDITLNLNYKDGTHRYRPKISYDGINWEVYDTTLVTVDTTDGSASIKLQVSKDTLWLSAQELITSKVYKHWVDELSKLPYVSNWVVGNSSQGRDIYKMEITGNNRANHYLFIISRQHPPEVTGFFAMKTFVETIAGNSETAKQFRNNFTTIVIPIVNPDGVDNGHWRHNAKGVDLNRDWVGFNQPEPRAVKNEVQRILSNPESEINFFIDFHSTTEDVFYTFSIKSLITENLSEERIAIREEGYNFINSWLANLQNRVAGYRVNVIDSLSKPTSPTSDRFMMREYDIPGLTYEVGDETDRKLIKRVAQAAAEEFMKRSPLLISP